MGLFRRAAVNHSSGQLHRVYHAEADRLRSLRGPKFDRPTAERIHRLAFVHAVQEAFGSGPTPDLTDTEAALAFGLFASLGLSLEAVP